MIRPANGAATLSDVSAVFSMHFFRSFILFLSRVCTSALQVVICWTPHIQTGLIDACTAVLTEKFSLGEMIQTPCGRSLLCAALCICCAETFIDGSSEAMGFAPAFAAALDDYAGSRTEAAVDAEIRQVTHSTPPLQPASPLLPEPRHTSPWFRQPAWITKWKKERKERAEMNVSEEREEEEQRKALVDIIKTHRLRFREERNVQIHRDKANLP
ncbi:hypothetical protein C8R45DRAFT_1014310 [Mycena sanguinolenta]|nr:hypothetical protein C8R45DRAFT_1014310 [Mycena sanguinolenta]